MQIEQPDLQDSTYAFLGRLNLPARGGMTDHVVNLLRDAIVASDLAPGSLVNKHAICDRLGVSRFPVSEALARLQTEGLVEILPQRGTRVTRIRIADVSESMFIRRALEAETMRELGGRISQATLNDLARNLRYQTVAVEADDRRGFHLLDLEFHQILVDALSFARVRAAIDSARANLERARRFLLGTRAYLPTYAEHVAIYDALAAHDGSRASEAMVNHLNRVMMELVTFSQTRPEVFEPPE